MPNCDGLLSRLPLAGVSYHTYDTHFRGQACKIANIVTRLALLVIGSLIIANVFPLTCAPHTILVLSASCLSFFILGSSTKRRPSEFLAEFIIHSVCAILLILSTLGTLTFLQAGMGIVGTLGGGILLGIPAERGKTRKVILTQIEPSELLLSEENIKETLSPSLLIAFDHVMGVMRDGAVSATSFFSSLTHRNNHSDTIHPDEETKGLCVLIHGLASRPAVLDSFHDDLSAYEHLTIFQPHVPQNGQCSLEDTVSPLYKEIKSWTATHPKLPIVLIGHSKGALVAAKISSRLTEKGVVNPIQVHCIAGPFNGTTFVHQPAWPNLFRHPWHSAMEFLYSKEAVDDLSWGSESGKTLIEDMQKQSTTIDYRFYATPSDAVVNPYLSSLPNIRNAQHFLCSAEGHQGILCAVQETVVEETLSFISGKKETEDDL